MSLQFGKNQLSMEEFNTGFGTRLNADNRWVKLSKLIPWESVNDVYSKQISDGTGRKALSARIALGSLIIKARLDLTDIEIVDQILESPYLQYFLGFDSFQMEPPFDPSMMTHFRKRFSLEDISQIDELIQNSFKAKFSASDADDFDDSINGGENSSVGMVQIANLGRLAIDATVAPADVSFPTDLKLLNHAREKAEHIIDLFHQEHPDVFNKKPRTKRQEARRNYLNVSKKKKPGFKKLRKGIKAQLQYLKRDLGFIQNYFEFRQEKGDISWPFSHGLQKDLWVIQELYNQQTEMYTTNKRSVSNRIVNIAQPHIRPIVRGKAGRPVEFGAKLSAALYSDGFAYVDKLDWNAYNEGGDLSLHVENFKKRTGHYPESVHADGIYGTRKNRKYLKDLNIRFSQKPLGRPKKVTDENREEIKREQAIRRKDEAYRVEIEGKFGEGKRRYGLDRIMTKLASTSEMMIGIIFLVLNLERQLRLSFCHFFQRLILLILRLKGVKGWLNSFGNEKYTKQCIKYGAGVLSARLTC